MKWAWRNDIRWNKKKLTVNMKCFEMFMVEHEDEIVEVLTVNMKCFEILDNIVCTWLSFD